jgi:WD40 repeat protein
MERRRGKPSRTLSDHNVDASGEIAFSRDGKLLASAGGLVPSIRIWDPNTGQTLRTFKDDRMDPVDNLAFSPDGKMIASGAADGTVKLWDAAIESLVRIF